MKLAETSAFNRVELTLMTVDFINKQLNNRFYHLGASSDVVLYECINDALNRIDVFYKEPK